MEAYLQCAEVAAEEWDVLELTVRARWLYCRVGGMVKLPEERRLDYLIEGLLAPLRAMDDLSAGARGAFSFSSQTCRSAR
jgi:hypothetical protein